MINLGYERIPHVLAIASIAPEDDCMQALQLQEDQVTDREITISFQNYVKSQLYCFIGCRANMQNFTMYVNAFHYLEGDQTYREDAMKVLRCFYKDMAAFLLHSAVDLRIHLETNLVGLATWEANLGKIEGELSQLFVFGADPTEHYKKFLDASKYAWMLDNIQDIADGKRRIHNFTVAAALLEMLRDKQVYNFVEVY